MFAKNGDLYFTDPPYGLPGNVLDPKNPHKELDFQGVYRLSPKGELTLLTKEMTRPNGIALSPDEKTLYVANSDPDKAIWMAFPVKADGTLGKGKLLHDATADVKASPNKGLPDGLKVDAKGNIFATGRQRRVRVRPGRHAPGPHRHQRQDGQLRLGRRRHRAVHEHQRQAHPRQDQHEGPGLVMGKSVYPQIAQMGTD